jgi:hypothetical protein
MVPHCERTSTIGIAWTCREQLCFFASVGASFTSHWADVASTSRGYARSAAAKRSSSPPRGAPRVEPHFDSFISVSMPLRLTQYTA